MGYEPSISNLLEELKAARTEIHGVNERRDRRLDEIEKAVNEVLAQHGRPGWDGPAPDAQFERKDAIEHCLVRHSLQSPRNEGAIEYAPTTQEIDEALLARKAIRHIWRHGDERRLDDLERKSLTAFNFGNVGWVMSPSVSSKVLSCLGDPTDFGDLFHSETISSSSIVFPIDSPDGLEAGWACETQCWPNLPQSQFSFGQIEVKTDPLRAVVCSTPDLLADASFSIENWVLRKADRAYRRTIAKAIITGDGQGKPKGILHPTAGIPVCDTSPLTPAGQLTWQDLVLLRFGLPDQFADRGAYLMNSRTLGLILTMSGADGRPIWSMMPERDGRVGFMIAGAPVRVIAEMPDVMAGSTPVAYGNWQEAYTLVTRSGLQMQVDPYSAGFCQTFKFEARMGGAVLCPQAARLLRVA